MDDLTTSDEQREAYNRAMQSLPQPEVPMFKSREEIENLTADQAMEVLRATRRMLAVELLHMERHEHMLDDCGDDLQAATENWTYMHGVYFGNDGDEEALIKGVKAFLTAGYNGKRSMIYPDHPESDPFAPGLGGCDGEIRHSLIDEPLLEEMREEGGG